MHISMSILANNIKISRSEKPQKNAKKPTICRIANVSWLDLETLLLHSYKPNRPTSTKILAQILFRYSSNIVVRLTSILTYYSSACVCLKVDATNKTVWKKFCLLSICIIFHPSDWYKGSVSHLVKLEKWAKSYELRMQV